MASSRVTVPSSRPRVAAKPPLVVARASKPQAASRRAEPASHGLGSSSGRPGTCRARNELGLLLLGGHGRNVAVRPTPGWRKSDRVASPRMDPTRAAHDSPEARLADLGLVLPGPYPPHDPLDAVVVHAGVARTSGQLPRDHDGRAGPPRHVWASTCPSSRAPRRPGGARSTRCRCCGPSSGRSTASSGADADRLRGLSPGLRPAAGGGGRGQPAAGRRLRRGRAPHPLGHRRGRPAPRRGGRDRAGGRAAAGCPGRPRSIGRQESRHGRPPDRTPPGPADR